MMCLCVFFLTNLKKFLPCEQWFLQTARYATFLALHGVASDVEKPLFAG